VTNEAKRSEESGSTVELAADDERAKKINWVAAQWKMALGPTVMMKCGCGLEAPIRFMYRCLYCGEFYCQSCAERHFGKTREQYNAERAEAMKAPETMGPWAGGHHWD